MRDIGTLGGSSSFGQGINAFGQITGESSITTDSADHAFLYSRGKMTDIGTLGGSFSTGLGINLLGQITGYSHTAGDRATHAFLYDQRRMTDIGTLGGSDSFGQGINAFGQITGYSHTTGDIAIHAFLCSRGKMTDIGTLGNDFSVGNGINDFGQVTGESETADGTVHAFLYTRGQIVDLNTRLPYGSGWVLEDGRAINDAGQITGVGTNPSGESRAFLLTPIYRALVRGSIEASGSSVFVANNRVVRVRFALSQNDVPTCALQPATVSVVKSAGVTVESVDEIIHATSADGGLNFRIDPAACQYVYDLAASRLGIGTYRVDISIDGMMIGHAVFALR